MIIRSYFKKRMHDTKLFKWNPSVELLVALITLLFMWASYYALFNSHKLFSWYQSNDLAKLFIFIILTNIILNVIFPVWWITIYKKQSISNLGISSKLLLPSIIISVVLAILSGIHLPELISGVNWLPQLLISALIFFEPFFVFGWLQIRFEKSFGIIPAIVLSALSFILYQIGSAPIGNIIAMFPEYLLLAIAFGLTNNIIAVWPIYWCIGSTVNQLILGIHHDWNEVIAYLFALIIQIGFIYYLLKNKRIKYN